MGLLADVYSDTVILYWEGANSSFSISGLSSLASLVEISNKQTTTSKAGVCKGEEEDELAVLIYKSSKTAKARAAAAAAKEELCTCRLLQAVVELQLEKDLLLITMTVHLLRKHKERE